MFEINCCYRTRAGLLIYLKEYTPKRSFRYVGYFSIRDVRIRVFYKENGDEYFGEKGLDIMERVLPEDAFVVKPIFDPKEARKQIVGERIP